MRVAEDQAGAMAADRGGEPGQPVVGEVERVEVGRTVEEVVAKPPLESEVAILGVAPDLGDALAEPPAGPLIRTDRAGRLPLHRGLVDVDGERHAGRTRRALDAQLIDLE